MIRKLPALLCLASLVGCTAFEPDAEVSGIFPCETVDDCPENNSCVARRCFRGEAPVLDLISPEDEFAQPFDAAVGTIEVPIRIGGEHLSLVDPGLDPDAEFGLGQIVVSVDGIEMATLTSGDVVNQVGADVDIPAEPGAHVIQVTARMSNGLRYDNPEAAASHLFWIDDGLPRVGIKFPQPGTVFPLEATTTRIEVATLNFRLIPSNPNMETMGAGHVHIHYNDVFPGCTETPPCDNGFIGIVQPDPQQDVSSTSADVRLPTSAAGDATLTATLREATHFNFTDSNGAPVWQDIQIRREDTAQ